MGHWPPQQILVPVDLGDTSGRACAVAARVARATGAGVTVFHVERVEVPPYFTQKQLELIEGELQLARRHAEAHVRTFAQAHGLTPTAVVIAEGSVDEGILQAARKVDLVVLGSQGRRGLSRWWIASVSERVIRAAPVPVLLVHAAAGHGNAEALLDRVLVMRLGFEPERAASAARALVGPAGGQVATESPEVRGCEPAALERATLVVVPLPPSGRARAVHEIGELLSARCTVPVLFVPDPGVREPVSG